MDNLVKKELRMTKKSGEAKGGYTELDPTIRKSDGAEVRKRFFKIMEDYHSGDEDKRAEALTKALKELEGFIHLIIKRSYSTYTKNYFQDLLQEGYLGVVTGMEKYDPQISMPTTFFFPYIKHEMQGFITKNVDKTTSHYSSNIKRINKAIEFFEEKGLPYTNVDIAIQTGMTVETVSQSMSIRNCRDEVYIDGCQTDLLDDTRLSEKYQTPESVYLDKEKEEVVSNAIGRLLTTLETQVLELHFGINGQEITSEGEIARILDIPKDKVKKALNGAIRKLKDSELKYLFIDYLEGDDVLINESQVSFVPEKGLMNEMEALNDIEIDF